MGNQKTKSDPQDYAYVLWEFNDVRRKSIIGFIGFISQILVVLFALALIVGGKKLSSSYAYDSFRDSIIMFILVLIIPCTIFWSIWFIESKKLRSLVTQILNMAGDVENFSIPEISVLNARFVPEGALVVVAEVIILLLITLIR
jgi:hypothetical protein